MSTCELSPQAHGISTVLTAFVGSILNGLFNGAYIAFMTGWICWLSPVRIVLAGCYEYYLTFKAGTDYSSISKGSYESIEMKGSRDPEQTPPNPGWPGQTQAPSTNPFTTSAHQDAMLFASGKGKAASPFHARNASWLIKGIKTDVTVFGWLGWGWSAVYTPVSQSIWLAANAQSNDGAILIVRAVAIGVSALGLTFDTKHRYAASLGAKWGSWAFVLFNFWNATVCLLLGAECVTAAVLGLLNVDFVKHFPAILAIYPIFCCFWAWMSFRLLPVVDGSRKGVNIPVDLLVGAFGGVFVAAPAIGYMMSTQAEAQTDDMFGDPPPSGLSLPDFLQCQGVSFIDKFAAIMP